MGGAGFATGAANIYKRLRYALYSLHKSFEFFVVEISSIETPQANLIFKKFSVRFVKATGARGLAATSVEEYTLPFKGKNVGHDTPDKCFLYQT